MCLVLKLHTCFIYEVELENMNKTNKEFKTKGWEGSQGGIYGTLLLHALTDATNPSHSHETYPQTKNEDLLSV
jgi:hypothetical protein